MKTNFAIPFFVSLCIFFREKTAKTEFAIIIKTKIRAIQVKINNFLKNSINESINDCGRINRKKQNKTIVKKTVTSSYN